MILLIVNAHGSRSAMGHTLLYYDYDSSRLRQFMKFCGFSVQVSLNLVKIISLHRFSRNANSVPFCVVSIKSVSFHHHFCKNRPA